jgi:hypothetical protein
VSDDVPCVEIRDGLAYIDGKLVGVLISNRYASLPNTYEFPSKNGIVRIAVAKDPEEFEQLSMYQWKANAQARKTEIQRKYMRQDNTAYEYVLKPMDEWMSRDDGELKI